MESQSASSISFKNLLRGYLLLFLLLAGIFLPDLMLFSLFTEITLANSILKDFLNEDFALYLLVGFTAQIIDGALGMAYGVSSTSCLISIGVSPLMARASVHVAEVVTTGISGLSHWKLGNVNK